MILSSSLAVSNCPSASNRRRRLGYQELIKPESASQGDVELPNVG